MAIVEGMFGGFMPSYDEALAGLMKQRQASNAAKTQGLGPYAGITQVGLEQAQQMGDYAGKALGYEQPELAKAKQRDQAWNEAIASVQNQSDPEEVYTALAKTFQKYGLTKEALQAATKASEAKVEKAKYGIQAKKAAREETEFKQKNIDFYTKNPDQASIELQRLAKVLETNPNDQEALRRYEEISAAGTSGAMTRASKEEKSSAELAKDKALTSKYKQEINDASKLGTAERWNAERDAALALFKANNIDPTKPLKGAALANTALVQAQRIALREPRNTGTSKATATKTDSAVVDPAMKAAVEKTGRVYDPVNFEYRITPDGQVQQKPKGK